MRLFRSAVAVALAYIVVFAIVMCSDPILSRIFPGQYVAGAVPPLFLLWTTTAIFALASILGGWICVRMAPSKPSTHLLALFILGEALGLVFTALNWGKWPHWHSLVWLVVWPVCIWIGALGRRSTGVPASPPPPDPLSSNRTL